jgi:hypothetical protein
MSRVDLLRRGSVGVLALASLGALGAGAVHAETMDGLCVGGSRGGCLKAADSYVRRILGFCSNANVESVADRIQCLHEVSLERNASRSFCRRHCPKPRRPKSPDAGGGGGGGAAGASGSSPTPTCGQVTCFTGDKCCKAGNDQICCAVGCRKDGGGCCSSESDCG